MRILPRAVCGMSQIFDVAVERPLKRARVEKLRRGQRSKQNAALLEHAKTALAAERSDDAPAAIVALGALERAITDKKHALCASLASSLDAAASATFGTARRYSIVYCDPPWTYYNATHECGTATQYETMSDEALARLPVSGLAHEDAALLMWATLPMMIRALALMSAWGFEYRTTFLVWTKVQRFLGDPLYSKGRYTRPNAELLLLGVRGNMRAGETNDFTVGSVLRARPREHSRKPPAVREMIVRVFGDLPRIELFARQSASDWDAWGNQSELFVNETSDAVEARAPIAGRRRRNNLSATPRRLLTTANGRAPSDRLTSADRRCVALFEPRPTASTAMTKLDYEIEGVVEEQHQHSDKEDNDDALRNVTDLRALMFGRPEYAQRHALYAGCSEAQVHQAAALVRTVQDHNADLLFARNYNIGKKARPLVRIGQ